MSNPLILHIETATDICSVAISEGSSLKALVESGPERNHASLLSSFIREAMAEAAVDFSDLQGIAVSKGPGSYTGLRIGVSTAKGLAYARNLPLLSCGTLLNLAHAASPRIEVVRAKETGEDFLLCPMLDARRMEVYSAFYAPDLKVYRNVSADIVDEESYADILAKYRVFFFGNGAGKCREILQSPGAVFFEDIQPSAQYMIPEILGKFGKQQFEDTAYFEPFYLKDFVATIPRKKVL